VCQALKRDPEAKKAILIRGRARLRRKNLDGAEEDLKFALKHFPKDKNVQNDLEELKKMYKQVRKKQQQLFAGMFDKKAKTQKTSTQEAKRDEVSSIISEMIGSNGSNDNSKVPNPTSNVAGPDVPSSSGEKPSSSGQAS